MVNHTKLRFMVEYQKKLSLKISEKYKNGLFLVKIRSVSYIFQRVNEVRENKSCFASQINIFNFGFTMRLSTFKIAVKSLLKITLTGVFLLNSGSASSKNHIQGLYDIDGDGLQESLVLNAGGFSAILVEFSETSAEDTVWQYNLPDQQKFNDAEVIDLDGLDSGVYRAVVSSTNIQDSVKFSNRASHFLCIKRAIDRISSGPYCPAPLGNRIMTEIYYASSKFFKDFKKAS